MFRHDIPPSNARSRASSVDSRGGKGGKGKKGKKGKENKDKTKTDPALAAELKRFQQLASRPAYCSANNSPQGCPYAATGDCPNGAHLPPEACKAIDDARKLQKAKAKERAASRSATPAPATTRDKGGKGGKDGGKKKTDKGKEGGKK